MHVLQERKDLLSDIERRQEIYYNFFSDFVLTCFCSRFNNSPSNKIVLKIRCVLGL